MSLYVAPKEQKAGPVGPGAGVLLTEFPLSTILGNTPQRKMRMAAQYGWDVPWIRTAERTICGKFSSIDWHLEDESDADIEDDYPNQLAVAAYDLLDKPQAHVKVGEPLTRSMLWWLTCRHLGLCGTAFWLLDQMTAGSGIPLDILYIRPDRMTPAEDSAGNLTGWVLDYQPGGRQGFQGVPLTLNEVMRFMFEPPDTGHFGVGLVESALMKAQLSQATDKHVAQVLSAGGRLSGFISPKAGDAISNDQFAQLVADFRAVVEQPDAAKRTQIMRGPIEFTPTTMSLDEIKARDLMVGLRDDLLALWGVPFSQVGGATPTGLNGGEMKKYDEASLWQGAVHPRLVPFREAIQGKLLDRWESALGWAPQFELDEPEFDDDGPRYELLQRAAGLAMTNAQRLDLVGLPPTGDPEIDNQILLPVTLVPYATVGTSLTAPTPVNVTWANAGGANASPSESTTATQPSTEPNPVAAKMAGETTQGPSAAKATIHPRVQPLMDSLARLRRNVEKTMTPKLKSRVADVLAQQKTEVLAKVLANWDHIKGQPRDTGVWWTAGKWDKAMTAAMSPHVTSIAETVVQNVATVLPPKRTQKADPVTPEEQAAAVSSAQRVLARHAARVSKINETTRLAIEAAIQQAIDDGYGAVEAGQLIERLTGFDEYRSEMIARTELMDSFNASSLVAYQDAEVEMVEAIDGDQDEECRDRLANNPYTVDDAMMEEDHPNGTLDWAPIVDFAEVKATQLHYGEVIDIKAGLARVEPSVTPEYIRTLIETNRMLAESNAQLASRQPEYHINIPAPITNIEPAVTNVSAPNVDVHNDAPVVNVAAATPDISISQTPPEVHVHVPEVKPHDKRVVRNKEGRVERIVDA